jgi:Tol biopolymer transport system component
MKMRHLLCAAVMVVLGCTSERPARSLQTADPEAFSAEVFAAGIVSSDQGESWISFDPSGDLAVFGRHNANWGEHTLYVTRREGGWSDPVVAPFSGTYGDRGARFSPDGRLLFFSSNRPRPGGDPEPADYNLWVVERTAEGWGAPQLLPAPVASPAADAHPSIAADGTVYFASGRAGGAGEWDLYLARPTSDGYAVESLGPDINTPLPETDVYVDPQQRFLVFVRTNDPSGFGGDDLYYSERSEDGWSAPRNLGDAVNTPEYEYGPLVSWDGSRLYFTSHANGPADLYEIAAQEVAVGAP